MTKATEINKAVSGNAFFFTDPKDGSSIPVNKVVPKKVDGKPSVSYSPPVSLDNLKKLHEKFAK